MRILMLTVMFFTVPALAQEGELKSVLVPPATPSPPTSDHPDAPEPNPPASSEVPDLEVLQSLPRRDREPNPIPGLEPITTKLPPLTPPQPPAGKKPRTPAQTVSSPQPRPSTSPVRRPLDLGEFGISLRSEAAVVRGVVIGSHAQRVGIRPGDTIERIGDVPVKTANDIPQLLAAQTDDFPIVLQRRGRRRTIQVTGDPSDIRARRRVPAQRVSAARSLTRGADSPPPSAAVPAAAPRPAAVTSARVAPPRPATVRRARPLIGDGGRLIGNGRVINSFRRMLRLD